MQKALFYAPPHEEWLKIRLYPKVRLIGIEPTPQAPEASALSTELQTHLHYSTILCTDLQAFFFSNSQSCGIMITVHSPAAKRGSANSNTLLDTQKR